MNVSLRAVSRLLGSVPLMVGWAGVALGGFVDEAKVAPLLLPPALKLHEPQAELVNAIALLLAVSLSMLASGYLFDGPFSQPSSPPAPPSSHSWDG